MNPQLQAERAHWTLLTQIDSDGSTGMMWGDGGCLYWLARHAEMTDSDLPSTSFTWQCHNR